MNDALRPFGAHVATEPMTPEAILRALGKVQPVADKRRSGGIPSQRLAFCRDA